MSGEKCAQITVDSTELQRALAGLTFGGTLTAGLAIASQLEASQNQLEEMRAHAMERELATYLALSEEAAGIAAKAIEFGARYDGLILPQLTAVPDYVEGDLDSIRLAVSKFPSLNHQASRDLSEALAKYQSEKVANLAVDNARRLTAQIRTDLVRSASALITVLDAGELQGDAARRDAVLKMKCKTAIDALTILDEKNLPASAAVRLAFASVMDAYGEHDAEEGLRVLRQGVNSQVTEYEEEKHRRAKEMAEEQNLRVRQVIMYTLQSMGYTVGTIEKTASAADGALVAYDASQPNHVLRFGIDESNQLVATPMRISDGTVTTNAKKDEDSAFDRAWCDQRIGDFRCLAKQRGVTLKFNRRSHPGVNDLTTMENSQLPANIVESRLRKVPGKNQLHERKPGSES